MIIKPLFTNAFKVGVLTALIAGCCSLALTSCNDDFDDTNLQNQIDDLDQRVTSLETWQQQVNSNISSLQALVQALQNQTHVSSVSDLTSGGTKTGYVITFSDGSSINIYHGADGRDGADGKDGASGNDGINSLVGIAQGADGQYYWTLNGEFLTDKDGNYMPVSGMAGKDGQNGLNGQDGQNGKDGLDGKDGVDGTNGADGKDGITPQLRINDDYNWEISTDNGATWNLITDSNGNPMTAKGADGSNGDSIFDDVKVVDGTVYFILSNGQSFALPLSGIAFEDSADVYNVAPGKDNIVVITGIDKTSCKSLYAEVKQGDNIDVVSPSRASTVNNITVKFGEIGEDGKVELNVQIPSGLSGNGVLRVTHIDKNDKETVIAKALSFVESAVAGINNDIADVISQGGTSYSITGTVDLDGQIVVNANGDFTLDITGATLNSPTDDIWNDDAENDIWSLISVQGGNVTLNGGTTEVKAKENDSYAVDVRNGAKLTINGGSYNGNISSVYVYEGELIINDGSFDIQQQDTRTGSDSRYLLNCYDANYKANKAKITVYGGKYHKFNPADNKAEGESTNFVAPGYASFSSDGNEWYTVKAGDSEVSTASELVGMVNSGIKNITLEPNRNLNVDAGLNFALKEGQSLNLNGSTITFSGKSLNINEGASASISGGKLVLGHNSQVMRLSNGGGVRIQLFGNATLELTDVEIDASGLDQSESAIICGFTGSGYENCKDNTLTLKNCNLTSGGTGILIQNSGHVVTLDGSEINYNYFGITQNGTVPGSTVNVNNSKIKGIYTGIYLSNQSTGAENTLNVDSTYFYSAEECPIEVKKTNIHVDHSWFKTGYEYQSYTLNKGGTGGKGYGVVLAGYEPNKDYEGTIKIKNCVLELGIVKRLREQEAANKGRASSEESEATNTVIWIAHYINGHIEEFMDDIDWSEMNF